jgi:hypothetical protein
MLFGSFSSFLKESIESVSLCKSCELIPFRFFNFDKSGVVDSFVKKGLFFKMIIFSTLIDEVSCPANEFRRNNEIVNSTICLISRISKSYAQRPRLAAGLVFGKRPARLLNLLKNKISSVYLILFLKRSPYDRC